MKTLVTGGTGFIGSHFIEFLLSKNIEVIALVRNLNNLKWIKGFDIQFIEGDLFSIPPLPADIEYVFHAAGLTKTSRTADYYTVNQQGTASFFEALRLQKIHPKRVIHLSSVAASGPSSEGRTVQESTPPQPITHYGKSKLLGELEALKFKDFFPLVILRIGAVYGPRDPDLLNYFKFIKWGLLPSLGSKQRQLSLCYVKDVVQAMHLSSQKEVKSGEIFNIADQDPYKWDDIGENAGRRLGKKLRKVNVPFFLVFLAALVFDLTNKIKKSPNIFGWDKFKDMKQNGWIVDTAKATEKLSFRSQYSLERGIQETVDWYLENNWL